MIIDGSKYALDLSKMPITKVETYNEQAISQSIESIIMTSKGERVMNPNFGSTLSREIFKHMTVERGEKMLDYLIGLIKQFEKRIYIFEDDCSMELHPETFTISLKIKYAIKISEVSYHLFWFKKKIIF